jgi:negative regulator of replication initiation
MKTIQIDDEVYGALLRLVRDFGDTPNSVLRRILVTGAAVTKKPDDSPALPIQSLLESAEFRYAKGAVGRFLTILSWLYKQHSAKFGLVEGIRGRGRLYFAKSERELEAAGRSVNAKQIPGSPYWVITTTPTILKQEMLEAVMSALGFDKESVDLATKSLDF